MAKKDLIRFSISVDWELLKEFDETIRQEGYENRSFAIRALFREFILSSKSRRYEENKGVFVILAIIKNGSCDLCEDSLSIFMDVPIGDGKRLCCCVVESENIEVKDKFRQFNASPNVEYCKLVTMEVDGDD